MDGRAAEERIVRVVEVAVGRVRIEQLRHLVHEPLEDGLEPELARHDLGRLEERGLLFEALRVLVEQLRGVDRNPEFARNGLGERDLGIRPRARLRAVEPEDPDHPVEHEDRRREDCAAVELLQSLDPAECRIGERRLLADVADGHGPTVARGQVRDREVVGDGSDRGEPRSRPLRRDWHRLARFAEPEEAAADTGRGAGRLDGDSEHVVEIELGAHLPPDRRDEAFALERVGQRVGRARPVECECRLGGERLQQRQLVSGEDARRLRRREHEHRGHPRLRDERDVDRALRAAPFGKAAVHLLRARDVVDDDRTALEDGARDSRRLAVEIDRDARPPVEVTVRAGGEEPLGALGVLTDEGDRDQVDAEEGETGVDQDPGDGVLVLGPDKLAGQRSDCGQLVGARVGLGLAVEGRRRGWPVGSTVPAKQHQ